MGFLKSRMINGDVRWLWQRLTVSLDRWPEEQGTWVHPNVAINLGQWCSPKFAVAVSQWVIDWQTGKLKPKSRLPYHLERVIANQRYIDETRYFSMLNELAICLIGPLERHGYILPENMLPDASEGRMFCGWLRKEKKIEPDDFPKYPHHYKDGRVYGVKLYPLELLGDFRKHFKDVWVPKKLVTYFKERDPTALEFIPKAFPRLYGSTAKRLT